MKIATKTLGVLDQLGHDSLNGRPWRFVPSLNALPDTPPAFVLHWPGPDGFVQLFLEPADPAAPLPENGGRQQRLSILPDGESLIVQANDYNPLVLQSEDPTRQRKLSTILSETRSSTSADPSDWPDHLALIGTAMRLLALTRDWATDELTDRARSRAASTAQKTVDRLHEWFANNLDHPIKLEEAAAHLDITPSRLSRLLKDASSSGFSEHYALHRLTRARAMLLRSVDSVQEIGRATGFNTREHFIRSFRQTFGWTPLQFRKAWQSASLAHAEVAELCQAIGRHDVRWLPADQSPPASSTTHTDPPHTLIVANALDEITELFALDAEGEKIRHDVLERGAMILIPHDNSGSHWLVRTPATGKERCFASGNHHALALVSTCLMEES